MVEQNGIILKLIEIHIDYAITYINKMSIFLNVYGHHDVLNGRTDCTNIFIEVCLYREFVVIKTVFLLHSKNVLFYKALGDMNMHIFRIFSVIESCFVLFVVQ